MSVTTRYKKDDVDIGTFFCDLTNDQTVKGTKTFETTPVVGTKASDNNSTSAASTAFVKNQAYATLASPTFTGTVLLPAPTANTKQAATTEFVKSAVDALSISSYAPLAGATFTGAVNVTGGTSYLNCVNLGSDQTKSTYAGRMWYDTTNAYVHIVGGGTADTGRKLKLWDDVEIQTSLTVNGYGYVTTPASTSNNTTIATTAWVISKIPASSTVDLTPYALKKDGYWDPPTNAFPYGIMPVKYTLMGHTENSKNLIALEAGNAYMYFGYNNTGNLFGYCTSNGATQLCSGSSGVACGSGNISNGAIGGILRVYKIEVSVYNF